LIGAQASENRLDMPADNLGYVIRIKVPLRLVRVPDHLRVIFQQVVSNNPLLVIRTEMIRNKPGIGKLVVRMAKSHAECFERLILHPACERNDGTAVYPPGEQNTNRHIADKMPGNGLLQESTQRFYIIFFRMPARGKNRFPILSYS